MRRSEVERAAVFRGGAGHLERDATCTRRESDDESISSDVERVDRPSFGEGFTDDEWPDLSGDRCRC